MSRHYKMEKSQRQAAIDGSNEITFAAIATTLAIAAIFIPVIFMKGIVGAFFYQYGITVTVAVLPFLLTILDPRPGCGPALSSGGAHTPPHALRPVPALKPQQSHALDQDHRQ